MPAYCAEAEWDGKVRRIELVQDIRSKWENKVSLSRGNLEQRKRARDNSVFGCKVRIRSCKLNIRRIRRGVQSERQGLLM